MCRAPRGACGLKFVSSCIPPRKYKGRAPRGACGLKSIVLGVVGAVLGRAPRGACGLKCIISSPCADCDGLSGPARGLWIEILPYDQEQIKQWSGPARGLWIEMTLYHPFFLSMTSGPARGLWIEMPSSTHSFFKISTSRAPRGACGLKL